MIDRWTLEAQTDLDELQDYIAHDNPTTADLVAARTCVRTAVEALANTPRMGHRAREGSGEGVFELVIPRTRYTVAYRIESGVVEILAVVHQSRRWPGLF
jgi:toxin ParE1/3/4